jgi:metallopeptidase MepB
LYRELFLVRDESARLLGYDNYASYSTKFQELGALDKVEAFLDAIEARAKAPAERDIAAMLKIKEKWLTERGEPNPHPGTLFRWESSFYMGKLKNLEAGIDYTRLDEYFPLDHCLQKCFEYFHHLFSVRAELVEASDTDVWHEEVSMYALWDDDSAAFLGWLYLDFFPREGKYSHFGHYGLQPVSQPLP